MLAAAAISAMGRVQAIAIIRIPVNTTAQYGVCRRGCTLAKMLGRLFSRPIANETREEAYVVAFSAEVVEAKPLISRTMAPIPNGKTCLAT